MKTLITILTLAFVIMACAQNTPTNTTNQTQTAKGPVLEITYSGAFTPPDSAVTVIKVTEDGLLLLETKTNDGDVTSTSSRQLTGEEFTRIKSIASKINNLQARYGQELEGQVTDVGVAELVINGVKTRIDPNIPEAYPAQLQEVRSWISEKFQERYDARVMLCPEGSSGATACTMEYLPVCGADGKTYSNSCMACATVTNYTHGACGEVRCTEESRNATACTLDYNPVCGNDKTYGNPCQACTNPDVEVYVPGECQSQDDTRLAFTTCGEDRPTACTKEYMPVCGEVDTGIRCITTPCPSTEPRTFGNKCEACANETVVGYWPGECGSDPSNVS